MNERPSLQFNALTDRWLPLLRSDGQPEWASPVEVLCGEKDGTDLDYPRDDFRVYARLLLSALVQALFAAKTKAELIARIESPLPRTQVLERIKPVLTDFDLFGPTPFLQIVPPNKAPERGAAPFVFPSEDLFPSLTPVEALSLPIALVTLFAEQTYAGGAGRGYGAGPAGQLGALTLVALNSLRESTWANTLSLDAASAIYAADGARPWGNEKADTKPRAATGLVAGLFFQPRSAWLMADDDGPCSFTGVRGPRVRRSPLLPKSELAKKSPGKEDLWQHPCAPLAVNSQGIASVRLNPTRPAWTGLAQLLRPLSKDRKKEHPREGPAPVVRQWKDLGFRRKRPRLLVLDFDRDKANVKRRFFESFPLTEHLLANGEVVERLRELIGDAQEVFRHLARALSRAHDDRRKSPGGLALADAEAEFWTATETPFFDWLEVVVRADDGDDLDEAAIESARDAMRLAMRRNAIEIFDAHVALSEFDPRKQSIVAKARRNLKKSLYPSRPATTSPTVTA